MPDLKPGPTTVHTATLLPGVALILLPQVQVFSIVKKAPRVQFTTGLNPGFACNARPANLTGKWQYKVSGNDSSYAEVFLYKWNTTTMTSDIIAAADSIIIAGSVTSWTNFSIPIYYLNGDTPDSGLIIFSAGTTANPVLNDYLYIDDLALSGGTVGIEKTIEPLNVSVTPNPFTSQTTIKFNEEQTNTSIKIIDMVGKEIKTINFTGKQYVIERGEMKEGIYFVKIIDGAKIYTEKIVVQ